MKWLILSMYFPALALAGQPQGSWTGVQDGYQIHMKLSDNGSFELSAMTRFEGEYLQIFAEWAEIAGTDPIETLTITGRGNYTVDDGIGGNDQLNFYILSEPRPDVYTNVGYYYDALLELAQGLARVLAEQAGVSEEEFVSMFLADFGDEGDPLGDMLAWLASGGTYNAERDVLTIEGVEFTRAPTAVRRASWGQVKAGQK